MSEKGIKPMLGALWAPGERVAVGLSLARTRITRSEISTQTTRKPTTASTATVSATQSSERGDMPREIKLGVAWFPSQTALVAADVAHYSATEVSYLRRRATTNYALGGEYYFGPTWAWRCGAFTNYGATPEFVPQGTNQPEHINLRGFATSISRLSGRTSMTLGLSASRGAGEFQPFANSRTVIDVERTGRQVFLATSSGF